MTAEILLVLTAGLPTGLACLWAFSASRRWLLAVAPWAAAPGLLLALHPAAAEPAVVVPAVFTGLHLGLDLTSRVFLGFTAGLWLLAGAFARSYHAADPNRITFFGFFVLTMAGNLGLVMAADVLTAYLGFALMTFSAYGLVIHRRDEEAFRAGRVYIAMAVLGELCILAALFTLGGAAGGIPLFGSDVEAAWSVLVSEATATRTGFLVVAGFGIKAGLVPLHLWLPLAHPVAPSAASALLSGTMIKAGLLAWLRHLPAGAALPDVATALLVLGTFTAFYGVVVGLVQDDPKTVLAYSSVSQMGYMAIGTGLLVRSPEWAPAAVAAVLVYATHHGFAKGALFLSVGVADRRPGAAVLAGAVLPAAALAGVPFSSGAAAKASLKDPLQEIGGAWYPVLDPLLVGAAFGTTLLMTRFLATLHRRMEQVGDRAEAAASAGRPAGFPTSRQDRRGLVVPWVILIAASAAGHLGYPLWFRFGPEVDLPGPGADIAAAALPAAMGAVVAWSVWKRPRILGRIGRAKIPPGDLVVPFEAAARRFRLLPGETLLDRVAAWLSRIRTVQVWFHARAAWAAERDLFLVRGPVLALLLVSLVLGLGLLLR